MNLINTFLASLKRTRAHVNQDSARDWLLLVTFSAVTLAGIIVWNVWAFDTVASGGVIGSSVPKVAPIFDPAALDTIHAVFAKRAAEESKYLTGTYRFADPSQ